jgi:polyhydroxybutyrate depolymerase
MASKLLCPLLKAFLALVLAELILVGLGAMLGAAQGAPRTDETLSYGGRAMIVHVPDHLPPGGSRALVLVLHGGLGNADRIADGEAEAGLNLDGEADRDGFIVAYLNGTAVARLLPDRFRGWNAGLCCGLPAEKNLDDVDYIKGAAAELARRHGADPNRIFAIGHSNGAMMAQRLICESDVVAAAVAISGPLDLDDTRCPAARGKRVLAIHGADDRNVPVAGGKGRGLAGVAFKSEAESRAAMEKAGAQYTLDIVPGADHFLNHIEAVVEKRDGVSVAQKAARFFELAR